MNTPSSKPEFFDLMSDLVENRLAPDGAARLEAMLRSDANLQREYVEFLLVVGGLHHIRGEGRMTADLVGVDEREYPSGRELKFGLGSPMPGIEGGAVAADPAIEAPPSPFPTIILSSDPTPPPFVGGPVFSFMVASVFMCLMLLGFWLYKISHDRGSFIASNDNSRGPTANSQGPTDDSRELTAAGDSPHARPPLVFVGQVTGLTGAKWSDDPDYLPPIGVRVALGRIYKLKSGLMEITYDSGAKVILEGPCDYTAESTRGGYLAFGKLVARVASGEWRVASGSEEGGGRNNSPNLQISKSPNSLATRHSPLFSVRTPTALVNDLGTEFGVEVDGSGATVSHVFQGMINVQTTADRSDQKEMVLRAHESARVEAGSAGVVKLNPDIAAANKFSRVMPQRVKIEAFSTGFGLKEGDADPRWQLFARSDDPQFQPRAAVVTGTCGNANFQTNEPARSQWISIGDGMPKVPNGVIYTFRTSFELPSDEASIFINFLVDNHINDIRLNGVSVSVPEHPYGQPSQRNLRIDKGFTEGVNVLEFDVENGAPLESAAENPMALRVELKGWTTIKPRNPAPDAQSGKKQSGTIEQRK